MKEIKREYTSITETAAGTYNIAISLPGHPAEKYLVAWTLEKALELADEIESLSFFEVEEILNE